MSSKAGKKKLLIGVLVVMVIVCGFVLYHIQSVKHQQKVEDGIELDADWEGDESSVQKGEPTSGSTGTTVDGEDVSGKSTDSDSSSKSKSKKDSNNKSGSETGSDSGSKSKKDSNNKSESKTGSDSGDDATDEIELPEIEG